MATRTHDCFFFTKGHKIVEILALLTTKLPKLYVYYEQFGNLYVLLVRIKWDVKVIKILQLFIRYKEASKVLRVYQEFYHVGKNK